MVNKTEPAAEALRFFASQGIHIEPEAIESIDLEDNKVTITLRG